MMHPPPVRSGSFRWIFVFLLPWMLLSCSTVTRYPSRVADLLTSFEQGDLDAALASAEKRAAKGKDRLLYLLEGGLILHTRGSLEGSNTWFDQAEEVIRHYEEKAVLSLSEGTAQLGTLVLNEKAQPYQGEPFEKVLVNTYKALNYLLLHEYEDARVEIRRSFARQKENLRLHEKELDRLGREAKKKGIRPGGLFRLVEERYQDQDAILRRAKNLYEDAFSYYISALVYEMNREYNDAYIDLVKVEELRPGVSFVENDLLRMARRSSLYDRLRKWRSTLGREPRFPDRKTEGEFFLFFGCGMAPRKEEIKISLPIPDVGMVSLAFPKYRPVPNRVARASIYDAEEGVLYGRTYLLTDLEAIAIRNLHDRMPTLVLKQILRAAVKGAVTKTARDQGGWAAGLVADIYSVVTEQADLRCWMTLPQNIQAARFTLPAGERRLVLVLEDASGRALERRPFTLKVAPGGKVFAGARSTTRGLVGFTVFPLGRKEG